MIVVVEATTELSVAHRRWGFTPTAGEHNVSRVRSPYGI